MSTYAIIGFGCAGYHALTAIRQADPNGCIDVYSDHPDPPYNPMLTTYYASNRLSAAGVFPFGSLEEIAEKYHASIFSNTTVTGLKGETKEIVLADGTVKQYDKILLATGAVSFTPPIVNECPEACVSMRNMEDSRDFKNRLENDSISCAVVIGASMAGIKVVECLHNNGISVTLADMAPHIFPLAAYPETAHRIEDRLTEMGVTLAFGKGLKAIHKGTETRAVVECSDGTMIPADLVGLCIGTRANIGLAKEAGIACNRGILVNENMETSIPGIYAAGDCAEGQNLQSHTSQIIGLWANAGYQGNTAGANMSGGTASFSGNILHNITHFMGMDFIGFGDNRIQGDRITFYNKKKDLWIEAIRSEGTLAGINILGGFRVSGILKNYILTILSDPQHEIADLQRGLLLKEGFTAEIINELEGR